MIERDMMNFPDEFLSMEQLNQLSPENTVEDTRYRTGSVDDLLPEEISGRDEATSNVGSVVTRSEILHTLESLKQSTDAPTTVLHALLLEDDLTAFSIAADIGQDTTTVQSILVHLVSAELLTEQGEQPWAQYCLATS